MCIVSTVSSVRVEGNVSVRGVNKVKLRGGKINTSPKFSKKNKKTFALCNFYFLGHPLNITQADIPINGWAVECRVYAEVDEEHFQLNISKSCSQKCCSIAPIPHKSTS